MRNKLRPSGSRPGSSGGGAGAHRSGTVPEPNRPPRAAGHAVGRWEITDAKDLATLRRSVMAAVMRSREVNASSSTSAPGYHHLALAVTELATNALKYGASPGVVRLDRREKGWLLDVADGRADQPPRPQPPAPGRPGGNGLLIISQVCRRWGWYRNEDGSRKHVWVLLSD